jgi:hypothetical protein
MPDLTAMLLRRSLGDRAKSHASCAQCRRTPLVGERMHELDAGRLLCDLCFAALPDDHRVAVRSERVRSGERRLAVARKAA